MKRPNLSVVIYLCLVFVSGIAVGGFGLGLYRARTVSATSVPMGPEEMKRRYVEDLKGHLKLSPDQIQNLESILHTTDLRYRELREKYRPEVRTIHESQVREIRAILNGTQQVEYDRLRAEREKERRENPRKSPGGPLGKGSAY
jgi:hypothetical protein